MKHIILFILTLVVLHPDGFSQEPNKVYMGINYIPIESTTEIVSADVHYGIEKDGQLLSIIEVRSFPDPDSTVFYIVLMNYKPLMDKNNEKFLQFKTIEGSGIYLSRAYAFRKVTQK